MEQQPEVLRIDPNRDITEVTLEYMQTNPDMGYKYLKEIATKKGVIIKESDGKNSQDETNHAYFEKNRETGKPEVRIFMEGISSPKQKLWELFHELNFYEGTNAAIQESAQLAEEHNKKKKFWGKTEPVSADSFAEGILINKLVEMREADIKVLEAVGEKWTELGITQRKNLNERSTRKVQDPEIVANNSSSSRYLLRKLK